VLVVVCAVISAAIVLAVYRVEVHRPPGLGVMVFVGLWFPVVYRSWRSRCIRDERVDCQRT
jgi:hypothetical protein